MIKWLQRRAKARDERQRQLGYAWAAGELLSGRMSQDEVERQACNPFEHTSPFDDGAIDAVSDWRTRHGFD